MISGLVHKRGSKALVVFTNFDHRVHPSAQVELVRVEVEVSDAPTARAALIVALRAALVVLEEWPAAQTE